MRFNIKSHSVKWVEHDVLKRGGNVTLIRKSCRALDVPHLSRHTCKVVRVHDPPGKNGMRMK